MNDDLLEELWAYRDAVRIDALMEGPRFAGCNLSQLRRAYELTLANEARRERLLSDKQFEMEFRKGSKC